MTEGPEGQITTAPTRKDSVSLFLVDLCYSRPDSKEASVERKKRFKIIIIVKQIVPSFPLVLPALFFSYVYIFIKEKGIIFCVLKTQVRPRMGKKRI